MPVRIEKAMPFPAELGTRFSLRKAALAQENRYERLAKSSPREVGVQVLPRGDPSKVASKGPLWKTQGPGAGERPCEIRHRDDDRVKLTGLLLGAFLIPPAMPVIADSHGRVVELAWVPSSASGLTESPAFWSTGTSTLSGPAKPRRKESSIAAER